MFPLDVTGRALSPDPRTLVFGHLFPGSFAPTTGASSLPLKGSIGVLVTCVYLKHESIDFLPEIVVRQLVSSFSVEQEIKERQAFSSSCMSPRLDQKPMQGRACPPSAPSPHGAGGSPAITPKTIEAGSSSVRN